MQMMITREMKILNEEIGRGTGKMKMQERRAKELELEMVWESSQDIGDGADLFTGRVVKIFISLRLIVVVMMTKR